MSIRINNSASLAIDKPNQFPWKLYDILHTAENRNEEHIISWIRDGKAFKVLDRDLFIEQYMKKMFNQTKFKSFQRQLNLWGFERVLSGPEKGGYFHPLFVRGRRECCQRLTRVRLKGTGDKQVQLRTLDKSESPFSLHSVSSTADETISTTGAATFPVTVDNAAIASPTSLLGAFVDVSQPTNTATAETSSHRDSHQRQFTDLIQYQTSQQRREMIRNAAVGLSPDLSMVVVGALGFASAAEASQHNAGYDDLQRYQEEHNHPESALPTQQKVEPSINRQQQQEQIQVEQHEILDQKEDSQRRCGSSGLEALLSVSAQRRQEEELALLMGLSNHEAM